MTALSPTLTWTLTAAKADRSNWRSLQREPVIDDLPGGLDLAWHLAAGLVHRCVPTRRRLLHHAQTVLAEAHRLGELPSDQLRDHVQTVRRPERRSPGGEDVTAICAAIAAAAQRVYGFWPHVEQIAAAMAVADGLLIEMATGEGKTLVAAMAAVRPGWRGLGCHVITSNDYLAVRDAEKAQPLMEFCGVTVASIEPEMQPDQRRVAYAADVTYTSLPQVTADMLRDRVTRGRNDLTSVLIDRRSNVAHEPPQLVHRGFACAIIDEADAVMIDEAITPLLLSSESQNDMLAAAVVQAQRITRRLRPKRHYQIDEQRRDVELLQAGEERVSRVARRLGGIWSGQRRSLELVHTALLARHFYRRDIEYFVADGKVVIIDQSTGRPMPDRTWRNGVHQAVEAKEGLEQRPLQQTTAQISFQRFLRCYRRLGGMSGTIRDARRELWQVYNRPVVTIPPHRPSRRRDEAPRLFGNAEEKLAAVIAEVVARRERGQAVLIGTRSVEQSQAISELLDARDLSHRVLNAHQHAEEAAIVADAGQPGCITVATGMAGRGTDIHLAEGVAQAGGLHVILADLHESRRSDRQMMGRAGRQGDPGSTATFVSLDDEVLQRHLPAVLRRVLHAGICARGGRPQAGMIPRMLIAMAQRRASGLARGQRMRAIRQDEHLARSLSFASTGA